ncbi:MAG: hypothetical protein Q7R97_03240 [Candidatus Daviesbacteria bacterium]|nr:hypothetical protein [Candidatus Daviesbacteria bacterium]
MLPKEAILEYQAIYKKVFGRDISYAEAVEKGTELIKLFQLIYKPIKKEWVNKNTKRNSKNGI